MERITAEEHNERIQHAWDAGESHAVWDIACPKCGVGSLAVDDEAAAASASAPPQRGFVCSDCGYAQLLFF